MSTTTHKKPRVSSSAEWLESIRARYEVGPDGEVLLEQAARTLDVIADIEALGIYAHVLRRKGDTGDRLDALVRAADWAATGSEASEAILGPVAGSGAEQEKTPR